MRRLKCGCEKIEVRVCLLAGGKFVVCANAFISILPQSPLEISKNM